MANRLDQREIPVCARVALASVVVALLTVQSVHAQSDLDLLVASAPPNVMILFDNSGSMNHHLWDDDFDPRIRYPAFCAWPQVPTIAGSDCSENPSGKCPNNEYLHFEGGGIAAPHFLWGGSQIPLKSMTEMRIE